MEKRKFAYTYIHKYMHLLHALNVCAEQYVHIIMDKLHFYTSDQRSHEDTYHIAGNFWGMKYSLKPLKTEWSCLFVHEITPDIHESQHDYNHTIIIVL